MHKNSDLSPQDSIKKVGELIKDIKFAMLCTTNREGHLHSRPMTTQENEFDGTLWFFVSKDSALKDDLDFNSEINLAYANPSGHDYVSICGSASFVDDEAKKKELWKPAYKAWFAEGLNDPKLGLLKIDAHHAQYWNTPSVVAYVYNFAKSMITGKSYSSSDTHKVDLN